MSRPRLIERLDEGLRGKLTLVSAPAGYGKTTLVGDWITRSQMPTAWLSLDASDNDPARFLTYLIAALQRIDGRIGVDIQAVLQDSQVPPGETLLTRLVSEIEAAVHDPSAPSGGSVLVLDDFHLITAPPVHDVLCFLLDHLPPALHLIIAGRADPPIPISRLRVRGELTEVRTSELRFTAEEAAAFLNGLMGLGLLPADIAALEARTEGWIASLQLAALSMRGRQDKHAFIADFSGSHRYVLDYLVDEVMSRQPKTVQAFLRQTSVLDRFCAPLCDAVRFAPGETPCDSEGTAVLETESSRGILRKLENDNLFLVPLDDERRWYRYHHLFASFLVQRLHDEEPRHIPELHRRASRWYEAEGSMDDAIEQALAAGDVDRAARLVDQIAAALIVRRNPNALLKWVERLPSDYCQSYPLLCVWHAWALLFAGHLDAVEPVLQAVEANCVQVSHLPILGYVTTVRAYLANQVGDLSRARSLSHQALEQMADAPPETATLIFRGAAVIWLAVNYRHTGELDRARELFAEATPLNQEAGNYYAALASKEQLGDMAMMQGQLHRAAEHYGRGLQMAQEWSAQDDKGAGPLLAEGGPRLGLGTVLYQWNDLTGAARHLQRAIELGEWGETWSRMHGFRLLAYLRQAEGDDTVAVDLLQRACAIRDTIGVRQQNVGTEPGLVQLCILLSRRKLEMAHLLSDLSERIEAEGLQPGDEVDFTSPTGYHRESEYADLARALVALDRAGEALPLLERLLSAAQTMDRWGDAIRYLAQQALAYHTIRDLPSALTCLDQALILAEPEGYVRLFVDEGPPMQELLQAIRHEQPATSPAYIDKLLAAFGTATTDNVPVAGRPLSDTQTWGVESLSRRELEVLRLMAIGSKYKEVAEKLVISLNTVRYHAKNIYGKLGVHSRAQAVARGQELGLL